MERNKYYVYLLIDPNTNSVFYVGKGTKKRALDHLKDEPNETKKHDKIKEIQKQGKKVKIELLRRNLTENEAFKIEGAAIDLIGKDNLTNIQDGHCNKTDGRCPFSFGAIYGAKDISVSNWKWLEKEGGLLVFINTSYSSKLTPQELYDVSRFCWGVGNDREKVRYVLSIANGIVQEIYEPAGWFKAGATMINITPEEKDKEKWEFVGKVADKSVRKKFVQKSIRKYVNRSYGQVFKYVGIKE